MLVSGSTPSRPVTARLGYQVVETGWGEMGIRDRCGTTVDRPTQVPAVVVDSTNRVGQIGLRMDQSGTEANGVNSSITGDPLMVVY